MRRITGRGLPVLLAALLAACNNPFFSGLLDKGGKETPGPAVYTVTFDKNGGDTDAVPATKTVTGPATTIDELPAQPSRSGYDFTGWNTEAGGSGTGFTASTTVSGDITVYAQWQNLSDSYTVDFMLNDGTETVHAVKTVTVPATAIGAADFPANPARSGYDFAGWNTEAGGSGTEFTASTTVSGNITVYAKWQEILPGSYTVTFKMNDGTETVHGIKTVTPPATTVTDFPDDPARTGYTFADWNTEADGSGTPFTASTTVSAGITVYAKWTANTYTVIFRLNDGTETVHAAKTVTVPAVAIGAVDFPANPARSGYDFAGWNTAAGGSGTEFTASTTVSGDISVYAKWQEILPGSYTVTFKMNDGTETVHDLKTVTPPAATVADFPGNPVRMGYLFGSWNTAANGSGTGFTGSTTVTGNITVYAKWDTYSYMVTFDNDGGTTAANPAAKTVASPDTTIDTLPAPPTKTGYNFGGWYTEKTGGGSAFTASTTVTGNITVYAKWNTYSYTVTFDNDDGTTPANPATKIVASPATTIDGLPGVPPTKTGYNFGGWYTEKTGGGDAFTATTTVTENIRVYAKWDTYSYTVTFDNDGGTTAANPAAKIVASPATTIDVLPAPPTNTGYNFGGWYTDKGGGGSAFTASTTVTGNIKVYAKWGFGITLNLDAGDGAFSETSFIVSKSGTGYLNSQTVTITGTDYTNPRWFVDETLKGTGESIVIYAADYGIGSHNLSLFINKGGVSWSKEISFIITN